MTRQLNIRNDEVYRLAHRLAADMGKPVTEAMLTLLRAQYTELPAVEDLTPSQRATYEKLRALAREASKHKLPGATSDHRDLYDDFGLPK
ncbi:MAG TPA: type II toxin-antitoxin system VapB family antitoxin [Bauldia sp.]|nr:type II toxin-antitoxin system VapB family antitoxin [Bauldia sp.]